MRLCAGIVGGAGRLVHKIQPRVWSPTPGTVRFVQGSSDKSRVRALPCGVAPPSVGYCGKYQLTSNRSAASASTKCQASVAAVSNMEGVEDLPIYSQYPLDRCDGIRRDASKVAALLAQPDAQLLIVHRDKCMTSRPVAAEGSRSPAFLPVFLNPASKLASKLSASAAEGTESEGAGLDLIFLGVDANSAPYFALDVAAEQVEAAVKLATQLMPKSEELEAPELRPARGLEPMDDTDASLCAVAVGLAQFHRANPFSASSGAPTRMANGGFSRKCSSSNRSVYPRVDPAVIMLATCGRQNEWCLLGRKSIWPEGRYSTLAGFLNVGESLEQAVAREVEEESCVSVHLPSVRYVASQPWPFPQSLMVGFYARAQQPPQPATGFDLLNTQARRAALDVGLHKEEVEEVLGHLLPHTKADAVELEDTRWFHKDWLRAALSSGGAPGAGLFNIPGPYSLASRLIKGWLKEDTGGASGWAGDGVSEVRIDPGGVFKYVLIRLSDPMTGRQKLLVWGDARAGYHNHVLQAAKWHARQCDPNLLVEPLGGGRIEHSSEDRRIVIYGYSVAFGAAPHEVSTAIVKKWYPFHNVSCNYEGY